MKKKTRGFQGSLSSSSSSTTSKSRWPRESEAISQEERRKSSNKTSHLIAPCRDLGSLYFPRLPPTTTTTNSLLGRCCYSASSPLFSIDGGAATGAADWDHSSKNVVVIHSSCRASWTTQSPSRPPTFRPRHGPCVRVCLQTVKKLSKLLFHGACFGGFTFYSSSLL